MTEPNTEPHQELVTTPAEPELCHVVAKVHPFADTLVAFVEAGKTLQEILGDNVSQTARVVMGGIPVPRELWASIKPKPGVPIEVVGFPQGGNARKWIAVVVMVVVTILSYGAASGWFATAGGTFAAGSASAAALAAGISIVGTLAINALIAPPTPKALNGASGDPFNQLASITGTSNLANPYGTIPCVVGKMRYALVPLRAANDSRAVAIHEAAHAVTAWMVGKGVVRSKVVPSGAGSFTECERCLIEGDDARSVERFCNGLTRRQLNHAVLCEMVQAMAGPMAEGREKGYGLTWVALAEPGQRDVRPGEPPSDLMAWAALSNLPKPKDRRRIGNASVQMCMALLAIAWPRVEAVADLLQEHGEITGADLVPIMGDAPDAETVLNFPRQLSVA